MLRSSMAPASETGWQPERERERESPRHRGGGQAGARPRLLARATAAPPNSCLAPPSLPLPLVCSRLQARSLSRRGQERPMQGPNKGGSLSVETPPEGSLPRVATIGRVRPRSPEEDCAGHPDREGRTRSRGSCARTHISQSTSPHGRRVGGKEGRAVPQRRSSSPASHFSLPSLDLLPARPRRVRTDSPMTPGRPPPRG